MSNVILIGFMGCGKSSIGRFMARNGYRLVDTDSVIEKDAGRTIKEIFADEGEEYFRRKETDILMELIQREEDNLVVAGGRVVPWRQVGLWLREHLTPRLPLFCGLRLG